jgi:hypothetical protein
MQDFLSYHDAHYHPATMMARRGGPPSPGVGASGVVEGAPPPALPAGVEASGLGGGAPPPPPPGEDASAAIELSPRQVDGGGGEGGPSSSTDQEESATDDVGVDYEGPKTHPPSHN